MSQYPETGRIHGEVRDEEYAKELLRKEEEKKEKVYQLMKRRIEEGSKKYFPNIEVILDSNSLLDCDFEKLVELLYYKPVIRNCFIPYIVVKELDDIEKRSKNEDQEKYLQCKGIHYIFDKATESNRSNLEIGVNTQKVLVGGNRNDDMIYEDCKKYLEKRRIDVREPKILVFLITNDRNLRVKASSLKSKGMFVHNRIDEFLNDTVPNLMKEFIAKVQI